MKNIRQFYNIFSNDYDLERTTPYFSLVNALEIDKVIPYVKGKKVLEVGTGTGLLQEEVEKDTDLTVGIDLSEEMLHYAVQRKLHIAQADVTALPFKDCSFDVVYSFKVLPHVLEIKKAMEEIARITKSNGLMFLEFYNPYSIKYIVNKIAPGRRYFQRNDSFKDIKKMTPLNTEIVSFRGIRIITPINLVYRIPVVSSIFKFIECKLADTLLGLFGGYFIVVFQKTENN
ncbi:class I SAM-dependent methyltransferase [bacterium]|nr:class I SAM-dependent methyltransferase [bacterium]